MASKQKDHKRPDNIVRWHTCDTCGKRAYRTKDDAKRARKLHHEPRLGFYRCGDYYHIGHKDETVVSGQMSRSERYR